MNPKLTIVIPTINRSHLLRRAVESALAQTAQDIEIIVSNNGSTDDTQLILASYADPRLRILHRDITIDACSHGNYLLEQARGELFLGLSDDDYIEPDLAALVIDFFSNHTDLIFAYTGCAIHYAEVVVPSKTGPSIEPGMVFLENFLAGNRDVCWCACITRTEDLRKVGNIPAGTICGDMFYWTKLATWGRVGCIDKTLSHYISYRNDADNVSTGTPVKIWANEVKNLTDFMVNVCIRSGTQKYSESQLRELGLLFLSRSTADQFIWNALRGCSRFHLLEAVIGCREFLKGSSFNIWIRVIAAIASPRRLLLSRVLATARKKSQSTNDNSIENTLA